VRNAEKKAKDILLKHQTIWKKLAKVLIEKETVDENELKRIFKIPKSSSKTRNKK